MYLFLYLGYLGLTLDSGLHATATRRAITKMHMPALSPTMTEGGVSGWKKQEGESFSAGDVLLEIVRAVVINLLYGFR